MMVARVSRMAALPCTAAMGMLWYTESSVKQSMMASMSMRLQASISLRTAASNC